MENFANSSFTRSTILIQESAEYVSLHHTPTMIQKNTDNRLNNMLVMLNSQPHPPPNFGVNLMNEIINTRKDITNINTFRTSSFLGIALFKIKNTLDTRRFAMACVDHFITPTMVTRHNIHELFHYAYHLMKNPRFIYILFPERKVDQNHDYYPKLIQLLSAYPITTIQTIQPNTHQ